MLKHSWEKQENPISFDTLPVNQLALGLSELRARAISKLLELKVALSQKVQDSFFIARIDRKNIPKNYLKLLHPLQGIDNMSILKKITFTCLIYLQV